jgi:MFS family permease
MPDESRKGVLVPAADNEAAYVNNAYTLTGPEKDVGSGPHEKKYNNNNNNDNEDEDDDEKDFHNQHSNERPDIFHSTWGEIICVLMLTMAPVTGTVSVGGLQIGLEKIGSTFDIDSATLSWALSSFALASGSFFLFFGGIADIFGRRIIVISSFISYAIFSLIAGFMKNFIAFCILRALQGMASAASIPAAVGILGAAYKPGPRKNRVMATFAAGAPIGFIIGIISGGICAQFLSFRAVLWFYAILWTIFSIIAWFVIPQTKNDVPLTKKHVLQGLNNIDYGGTFLAIAGFTLFVFALSQAEAAPQQWKTPYIIALLIVGIVIIGLFVLYENYVPANPLMPMSLWTTSWQFPLCMVIMAANWMNFTGTLSYYGTLYFQVIREASPILTTAYWIPQAIAGMIVNFIVALTLHRIPGKILMLIATLSFLASALLWAFIPIDIIYWAIPFPAMILVVVGADVGYNVANMMTLTSVPKSMQSSAAGVFNTILQLSTAIGLAASSAVASGVASTFDEPLTKAQTLKSYHAAFYFAVAVAGCSVIATLFLKVGTYGSGPKKSEEENTA